MLWSSISILPESLCTHISGKLGIFGLSATFVPRGDAWVSFVWPMLSCLFDIFVCVCTCCFILRLSGLVTVVFILRCQGRSYWVRSTWLVRSVLSICCYVRYVCKVSITLLCLLPRTPDIACDDAMHADIALAQVECNLSVPVA